MLINFDFIIITAPKKVILKFYLLREKTYKGIPASQGISIGRAYLYARRQVNVSAQHIREEEVEKEIEEIKKAIEISLKELNKIFTISLERIGEKNSKIFEAQIEILKDNIFLDGVIKRVSGGLRSAGYVFSEEIDKLGSVFLKAKNDYLKERYTDIMDVKNRVLRNMRREKLVSKVEENAVIFAHELSPADTILFSRRKVQGYATDTGGVTSHAAIISRALRVPAVVGMKMISKNITTGDMVIIDGFDGTVIVNPNEKTIAEYTRKQEEFKHHESLLYEIIDLPCRTLDGKKLDITSNIEFIEEVDFVYNCGHCGIGLYRTEHLYMDKGGFPSQAEQIEEYTHIANITFPKTLTIRTFDLGGDKIFDDGHKETNPYLGWRGIRVSLDRLPEFKDQLRAMLISSVKKNIRVMLPMITSLEEVRRSKEIFSEVKTGLEEEGLFFDREMQLGIMLEVPSAFILARELAKEVDFFSIGTNDLIQYLLAVDRGNELISDMYQQFHPAVIRALKGIIDAAHEAKIPVSICGEMASVSHAVPVLVGMGIDELSVLPSVYPEIKQIVRSLNFEEAKKLVNRILKLSIESEIKEEIEEFFKEKIKPNII